MKAKESNILYMNFNQDQGCFSAGTETGFKIYNTSPFKETFSRDLNGGIKIVEMLYRCNILALVGGGKNPKFPPNKVMLWDDHQVRCIGELSFRSEVQAVKLRTDRIIVVLENKIFCYNFSDLRLLDCIETCPNPRGLCSVNTELAGTILACPDKQIGHAFVRFYDQKKTTNIKTHQSALSALELNSTGTLLATASEKGTIIRIYDLTEGVQLQELRRGSDYAQIYSVSFDSTSRWLSCSSDSGTIHIFNLKDSSQHEKKNGGIKNQKSKLSFMKVINSYFDSEWSFAQLKVAECKSIAAFQPPLNKEDITNTLTILGFDCKFYQSTFDTKNGGECKINVNEDINPEIEENED